MASGLPVVHAASGGVPELVGSDAGIGVPDGSSWTADVPADPQRLAEAALRVLADRDRYAQAARRRAVARFSLAAWLGRHREIFRELAAG
jgi:glycosyltransferase involved in cell wall biosynthesis